MLVIRREQLRNLRESRGKELEDRLVRRLKLDYPEDFETPEQDATGFVRATLRSAASRGVTEENDIVSLMRLYVLFGRELELAPHGDWANEMLDHPSLPGTLKVNLVSRRLLALTHGRRILLHREEN